MTMQALDFQDLPRLDRDVARAHAALVRWRTQLALDPEAHAEEEPLAAFRHIAGKRSYEILSGHQESVHAPLSLGLARWVAHLTEVRVVRELDVAWARVAAAKKANAFPEVQRVSWRDAWRGVVQARSREEAIVWLDSAAGCGPELATVERERNAHRHEVARRLGAEDAWSLATGLQRSAVEVGATELLAATHDVWRMVQKEACTTNETARALPVDAIRLAVARDAPEGWPAHLTTRWLAELFPRFGEGLSLEIGSLPAPVGASSFARALAAFGFALRVAGPAASLPFALARSPNFVDAHRFAAVFAALSASDAFQRRALGNTARIAAAQTRALWRTLLFDVRLSCVRVLVARDEDRFEELTTELCGTPMPNALAGAWPIARDDEAARALATLTWLPLARDLVERFDVDWFRNPRAAIYLRARASGPAWESAAEVDTGAAARSLALAFEEKLA